MLKMNYQFKGFFNKNQLKMSFQTGQKEEAHKQYNTSTSSQSQIKLDHIWSRL